MALYKNSTKILEENLSENSNIFNFNPDHLPLLLKFLEDYNIYFEGEGICCGNPGGRNCLDIWPKKGSVIEGIYGTGTNDKGLSKLIAMDKHRISLEMSYGDFTVYLGPR